MRFGSLNRRIARIEANVNPTPPPVTFENLSPQDQEVVLEIICGAFDQGLDDFCRGQANSLWVEFFRELLGDSDLGPVLQDEIKKRKNGQAGSLEERLGRARGIVSQIMGA